MIRKLSEEEMDMLLEQEIVGRMACTSNGKPYVVPMTFVFADGCIYGETTKGRKVEMLRQNPAVCFEVSQMGDLTNWRSVLAWGRYEEMCGEAAEHAADLLAAKMLPHVTGLVSRPPERLQEMPDQEGAVAFRASWLRGEFVAFKIVVEGRSGRCEEPY